MSHYIERPVQIGFLFVDPDAVEDPSCMNLEAGDPFDTFRDYVLPRIKSSRDDEAASEVLKAMRSGRSFADAVLDTIESLSASKTAHLRDWVDEARGTHIYRFVDVSGDWVSYGLILTTGGPKDTVIASGQDNQYTLGENFAQRWDFEDALKAIENSFPHHEKLFEENPFVEIYREKDYDLLLLELNISGQGGWVKPGLYDLRDEPPSYSGTVDQYIHESAREEAEDLFSNLEIEDLQGICTELLEESKSKR